MVRTAKIEIYPESTKLIRFFRLNQHAEADNGKQGVEYQKLIGELITAEPPLCIALQDEAQNRCDHRHQRDPFVTYIPLNE